MSKTTHVTDGAALKSSLSSWPFPVQVFDEIPSTNTHLIDGPYDQQHGTLVVAHRQTAGKGRLGRTWLGDENSAAFSLLLHAKEPWEMLQLVPVLAAVSVLRAASSQGVHLFTKWPNDLLDRDGRKVCGILTEMRSQGGVPRSVVVGVGINVNQHEIKGDFLAQSLRTLRGGIPLDRSALILDIARELLQGYESLQGPACPELVSEWKRACTMFGGLYCMKHSGETFSPIDMEDDGSLVVRYPTGVIGRISAGEVVEIAHRN
ncbi:biotin--[acetyl-CoA-carboxylase] ligase [Desulfurispira natronophila]|uniref:BirA family biotin operon repressor/biotin-[acetyl-CoA-carboxylase] ligase n=1 Tax=Desulfurispira natronophila TaxID=682562 RepID=A0A7W7Y3K7_9BACT|nr:biotin--[acetyl-CoA-carboxylase] ligase [Desulfurispira natronophila]MBB5021409.1 BirA family biotin operon repressor/biotin-[acetyl-CoA-carboxylase] ligase [Desulfurispira natronophila]